MRLNQVVRRVSALAFCIAIVGLAACSSKPSLMTTPTIYRGADLNRYTDPSQRTPEVEVFYATDRIYDPSLSPDPYPPQRERFLRLGVAKVRIGSEAMDWPRVAELSVAPERDEPIETSLVGVEDFGPLSDTTIFFDPISSDPNVDDAKNRYTAMINDRLAKSRRKIINIYVAPFKVNFDHAAITAAEFQHYLGRDGVFIAYSWPTKTGTFNYLTAVESAYRTRRLLRLLIEYLAHETDVERINLITYSAGARVLSGALHQLSLVGENPARGGEFKLGKVIFCGADIDKDAFTEHIAEGIHEVAGSVTIYSNAKDMALRTSRFLYRWDRLGVLESDEIVPQARKILLEDPRVEIVSVMNADDFDKDNGHGYFRGSPDVASDILLMLGPGLDPAERGLVRTGDDPIWRFPDDYDARMNKLRERFFGEP